MRVIEILQKYTVLRNIIMLIFGIIVISCSSENEVSRDSKDQSVALSESSITTGSSSGSTDIEVNTNAEWEITNENSWIHFSQLTGSGKTTINVSWESNSGKENRVGLVIFSTLNQQANLTISQKGNDLELVSFKGIEGNDAIKTAKYLIFNKSITLVSLKNEDKGTVFNPDDVKVIENGKGFQFEDGNIELGRKTNYSYIVEDNEGNTLKGSVAIKNFSKEINFNGRIIQHFQQSENTIWVLTANSELTSGANKLFILSEDLEILNVVNLPNKPKIIVQNPHNNLYYIIYSDSKRIDLYNKDLHKVDELNIDWENIDIPGIPAMAPVSIAFNKSGKGIIMFSANGNEQYTWRFIDSANDHQLSSAQKEENKYNSAKFIKAVPNHDYSKHFLIESGNFKTMKVFDNNGEFEELEFTGGNKGNVIFGAVRPSRLDSKVYICGLYNQFIYDMANSQTSNYATFDHTLGADFTYENGTQNTIYSIDKMTAEFRVFNYATGKELLTHPIYKPIIDFGNHIDFFTMTNGEEFILSTPLNEEGKESRLLVFNKEMFFE